MKKILIIDDDEAIRESLSLFLTIKGYESSCASDGEDGWNKFQELSPDILLIDYRMPKLNGTELIHKIRELDEKTPIILCSADKYLNELNIECGMVDVVKKPFQLDALMDLIAKNVCAPE